MATNEFPPNRLTRAPCQPLVFQQAIIPQRGSSLVNVGLSRDTPSITDLFAGRSARQRRARQRCLCGQVSNLAERIDSRLKPPEAHTWTIIAPPPQETGESHAKSRRKARHPEPADPKGWNDLV